MVDKYRYGVVKVKASLMDVDDSQRFALKRVGGVLGDTVSRVFLIPDDIQLWALHYAMTTAFGFLNEHLHAFHLTEEDFRRLTGDKAGGWMELCGKLFRSPFMDDEDVFWCDDYSYGTGVMIIPMGTSRTGEGRNTQVLMNTRASVRRTVIARPL